MDANPTLFGSREPGPSADCTSISGPGAAMPLNSAQTSRMLEVRGSDMPKIFLVFRFYSRFMSCFG